MSRLVVMYIGEPYDFKGDDGRQVKGTTVWAFDPDARDPLGVLPFKIAQRDVRWFPRPRAVYGVRYGTHQGRKGPETQIESVEYLEEWSPLGAHDEGVLQIAK